jgi:hypothetical protein
MGPYVLIVRIEVTGSPFTGGLGGLKEHTGGFVTSGVMETQDNVTPCCG